MNQVESPTIKSICDQIDREIECQLALRRINQAQRNGEKAFARALRQRADRVRTAVMARREQILESALCAYEEMEARRDAVEALIGKRFVSVNVGSGGVTSLNFADGSGIIAKTDIKDALNSVPFHYINNNVVDVVKEEIIHNPFLAEEQAAVATERASARREHERKQAEERARERERANEKARDRKEQKEKAMETRNVLRILVRKSRIAKILDISEDEVSSIFSDKEISEISLDSLY